MLISSATAARSRWVVVAAMCVATSVAALGCVSSGVQETQARSPASSSYVSSSSSSSISSSSEPIDDARILSGPGLEPEPLPTRGASSPPLPPSAEDRTVRIGGVVARSSDDDAIEFVPRCPARTGRMTVRRSVLSHTLDAGLGNWLRGVEVEPQVDRGHFQGWMVRGLFDGDPCWNDVGLQAGDVVHRVNHHAIEKPEQAQAVWTALRSAPEISVEFVRAGQLKTLTFSVVDDGTPRSRR